MDVKEHARRRKRVMEMMDHESIAIIPTSPERQRNRDIVYQFRPDSDFHYLTGFPEPMALAVLVPGREQGEFLMFCRERDAEREQWDGSRAGLEGACDVYGADDAFPIGDVDDILPGLMENRSRVFYAMGYYPEFDQRMLGWVKRLRNKARGGMATPAEFLALDHILHDLRLYKSRGEVKLMRRAAEISARAHRRAMQTCREGLTEYQIEAEITHEFMRAGSRSHAYPPIVASGANACTLHYVENTATLRDGDLLLIGPGCEYHCYASDITRTFPVNGRFSAAQLAAYDVVLEANLAAIDAVRVGNDWNRPHEVAVEVLTAGMVKLGLLKGRVPALIKSQEYRRFYMHRTGHWLGMDVHDVGDYKIGDAWRLLEPSMVLTIEPGLYVAPGTRGVPPEFRGLGIRIEDDVLVTQDEPEVLTSGVPKSAAEIEALMSAA